MTNLSFIYKFHFKLNMDCHVESVSSDDKTICTPQHLLEELEKTRKDFEVYISNYEYPENITKSGKKKLNKKLRFEYFRPINRKIERDKIKRKRSLNPGITTTPTLIRKRRKIIESSSKLRIAIDCSYDDLMNDRDVAKLTKQMQRCYTLNRNMENPLQLYITHLKDKTFNRLESSIMGYKNWDVYRKSESLTELFSPTNVVYLCAESENILNEFDEMKVYAIGGFVDHNSHKGLAYKRAVAAGFEHARLPIEEFFTISTRKVLTVCHVYEIISNFCEGSSWSEAIRKTIPERKGLKNKDGEKRDTRETEDNEKCSANDEDDQGV